MMDYATSAYIVTKKPIVFERIIYQGSLVISGLSALYLLSVFITGNSWLPLAEIDAGSSKLTLSLIQCLLGAAALYIPTLITKTTHVKIPDALSSFFYIFILCATVLGEMFSLYYAVPFWDSLLHCGSGIMSGMLGSILIVNFFQTKKCGDLISPIFIAIAAVCFALSVGVIWEIYEFSLDCLLGLNMQKFMLQDGTGLIGQAALADTMKDLIVDSGGAIIAAVSSYYSLKQKKG